MFNGIIEVTGKVISLRKNGKGAVLSLNAPTISKKVKKGDSVAVDGTCLTVTVKKAGNLSFDVSGETWERTNLSSRKAGQNVNLELPLTMKSLLSGHFVQGHVEGLGRVKYWIRDQHDVRLIVELPPALILFCVPKGSIAINGVSLTIASQKGRTIGVALIPYTLEHTNLNSLIPGDAVNIETDMIGRYVVAALKKSYDKRINRRTGSPEK